MSEHPQKSDQKLTDPWRIYKFGIMVNSLDMSQKGFCIVKQLNQLVDSDYRFSPTIFYKEYARGVDVNRFCTLLEKECWGYDGIVIATSLETANALVNCPCPIRKYFYVWDLEWLYDNYTYKYLQDLYQSNLSLIARNESHAHLLSKYWQEPEYVMHDFDANMLQKIITDI